MSEPSHSVERRTASRIVDNSKRMVAEIEVLRVQMEADICRVIGEVIQQQLRQMLAQLESPFGLPYSRALLGQTELRARWTRESDTTQALNSNTQRPRERQ